MTASLWHLPFRLVLAGSLAAGGLGACSADDAARSEDDSASRKKKKPAADDDDDASPTASCEDVVCQADESCKAGECVPPTEEQRAQASELELYAGYIKDNTAWHSPLDWPAIVADGKSRIFRGDGGPLAYFDALYHVFIRVPQGHQGLYLEEGCGRLVPSTGYSVRGACGRPHPRGIVVTNVAAGNPLGLAPGDLVVRLGATEGRAILTELADRPYCTTSSPGVAYRATEVSASFADLARAKERLEIERPDGTKRTVTIPEGPLEGPGLSCIDPLGRARVPAEATLLPSGVGVIRLPSFVDPEQPFPTNATDIEAYAETFRVKIDAAFAKVKSAKAIVWDVRGNTGGMTVIGLGILGGMPGLKPGPLSSCVARKAGSDPPAFDTQRYAEYAISADARYAYTGKVAILIDGFGYSATDYFAYGAKMGTGALLVGSETAGGFGATSDTKSFAGPPKFSVSVDLNLCSDATNKPLEGRSVAPDVVVDYDPKDLAAGKDTVLERAITELAP